MAVREAGYQCRADAAKITTSSWKLVSIFVCDSRTTREAKQMKIRAESEPYERPSTWT